MFQIREILFRAKTIESPKWAYGYYFVDLGHFIKERPSSVSTNTYLVDIDTLGQFTGQREYSVEYGFMGRIFEHDIVEVETRRRPMHSDFWCEQSSHDGKCAVRCVVVFNHGRWELNYNNKFNNRIEQPKGKEEYTRDISSSRELNYFQSSNWEFDREHNAKHKWHDIKVIGNIFDNSDLLE